jgi:hypothetical protein
MRAALATGPFPEGGPEVRRFIEGPLREAITSQLGVEVADAIAEELSPLVRHLSSAPVPGPNHPDRVAVPRPPLSLVAALREEAEIEAVTVLEWEEDYPKIIVSDFPELIVGELSPAELDELDVDPSCVVIKDPVLASARSRQTDPAPEGEPPRILVASVAPTGVQQLGSALAGFATIEPVPDPLTMLEALDRCRIAVVDCRNPSIRIETLMTMRPELPKGLRVVLWADQRIVAHHFELVGERIPRQWVCAGVTATAKEISSLCRLLLMA